MIHAFRPGKLLWLVAGLFLPISLTAQSPRTVIATGGSVVSNSTLQLSHTFGQPIIGLPTTPRNILWQGFWHQAPETAVASQEPVSGEASATALSLRCSPNPLSTVATIDLYIPEKGEVYLTLHDPLGREAKRLLEGQLQSGHTQLRLNVEGIASGWYTLTLSTGDKHCNLPLHIVQ